MARLFYLLIVSILSVYTFRVFKVAYLYPSEIGVDLQQILNGIFAGTVLGYMSLGVFDKKLFPGWPIHMGLLAICLAVIWQINSMEESTHFYSTHRSADHSETFGRMAKILLIAPFTLYFCRCIFQRWGSGLKNFLGIGLDLPVPDQDVVSEDATQAQESQGPYGSNKPSWIRLAIVLMVFSPLFRLVVNLTMANQLLLPERSLLILLTPGGQIFLSVFAVAIPALLIAKCRSFFQSILVASGYFSWLCFLLFTTVNGNDVQENLPVISLLAPYSVAFIAVSVGKTKQGHSGKSRFFQFGVCLSFCLLMTIVSALWFFNPIVYAATGNFATAKFIRKCQRHGSVSLGHQFEIQIKDHTAADFFNIGSAHSLKSIKIEAIKPHVNFPSDFLTPIDQMVIVGGNISNKQLGTIFSCKLVFLDQVEVPAGDNFPATCSWLNIKQCSTDSLNQLLSRVEPSSGTGIQIRNCELDDTSWQHVTRLAESTPIQIEINDPTARAAPGQIGSAAKNILVHSSQRPPSREFQILRLRSNLKFALTYDEHGRDFWNALFASDGRKEIWSLSDPATGTNWYRDHKSQFNQFAKAFHWVYGEGDDEKYYLPLESFSSAMTPPLAENLRHASSLSFSSNWKDVVCHFGIRDFSFVPPVMIDLKELYLGEKSWTNMNHDLSVFAPNLKILQVATRETAINVGRLGRHPSLEHLILVGPINPANFAQLKQSKTLKRLTVFQDANVSQIETQLETLLPGIEVESYPSLGDMPPPVDFLEHVERIRKNAKLEFGL